MSKQFKAETALLIIVFSWGMSYLMIGICLNEIGVATLNSLRFLLGFTVIALIENKNILKPNKDTIIASAIMSFVVAVVYYTATLAVKYAPISNIGFLTGLTVVFVPLIEYVFYKVRITKKLKVVLIMCLIGTALMTLDKDLAFNRTYFLGNMICVINAMISAVKAIFTCKFVKKENINAHQFGVYLLLFTGLLNLFIAFTTEEIKMPQSYEVWMAIMFLAVICTGLNFLVQSVAMQYTTPTKVGVIFSLEQVFVAIAAFVFIHEVLALRAYFGALLIFTGTIIMEVDIDKMFGKLKRHGVRETGS